MFRIYQQDNADHFDNLNLSGTRRVSYVPVLYQALRDLAAWVEKGTPPPRASRYELVDGQVVLPATAGARGGIQPVVTLTANGSERAEVAANAPVALHARIEAPPSTGQVVSVEWNLGAESTYEASVAVAHPEPIVEVDRTVTFASPGTYVVTLRATSQRNGDANDPTAIQSIGKVRVVVR